LGNGRPLVEEREESPMKVYTIGYGGRTVEDFLGLLKKNGVRALVDIRLRPDRASMGIWTRARTPDKGIEKTLCEAGIEYRSLIELGNVFLEFEDWRDRYRRLLGAAGDLLLSRLADIPEPFCLMCAEKRVDECHRQQVAEYLALRRGADVEHLE
jgi:uncharacterized protein (DUF488 family)